MRLRPENLERYATTARNILVTVASKRGVITYSELTGEMKGPGRGYIGQVLKEVCHRESEHGRPLLGSLVVLAKLNHPGDGFWDTPLEQKSLSNTSKQQRIAYWEKERRKVYEYWQKRKS